MTILDHHKAQRAVRLYPHLEARLPADRLERWARTAQIADAHRVYRMLATGGVGWGGEQLAYLDGLLGRLAARGPAFDEKVSELWKAKENRIDSLASELLVADELFAAGHSLEVEPVVGNSRPEYLVDGAVLLEVKTYCQSMDEFPLARLKHEITHRVDSGCGLLLEELTGTLTANDVLPLVKQLTHSLDRARSPLPGTSHRAWHGSARVTVSVSYALESITEGSVLSTSAAIVEPREAVDDFNGWLLETGKFAATQMKAYRGPKVLVLDVSLCRSICDAMALSARTVETLRARLRAAQPELTPVIAVRHANFGVLRSWPSLTRALDEARN